MICPKCELEQPDGRAECLRCGVIFAKLPAVADSPRSRLDATLPEIERPLYAMIGWFLVLEQSWFAWGLVTDPGQRRLYADAKGGGHWMDSSRLARDYAQVSLETVAGAFLVCCLLMPPAMWAFLRYRKPVQRWLEGWLAR